MKLKPFSLILTCPPFCLAGNGIPRATLADESAKTLALLNVIINADETAMVRDICPFIDALDAVRFNRPKINCQLHQLNLDSPDALIFLFLKEQLIFSANESTPMQEL
ncbi:hypothetical protein [Xenorhabdus miraniensis]|uniref:hypothetical protein n=1 Tax=Xenorhabdus miraniensis TaxID=351674 RepID=UPI001FC9ABD2|nr:hypothetical protein [Xenorhabdus miraniensis]